METIIRTMSLKGHPGPVEGVGPVDHILGGDVFPQFSLFFRPELPALSGFHLRYFLAVGLTALPSIGRNRRPRPLLGFRVFNINFLGFRNCEAPAPILYRLNLSL